MTIIEEVRQQVAAVCEVGLEEIDLAAKLSDLPHMDSLRFVELVAWARERWQIDLRWNTLLDVQTGHAFVDLVEAALGRDLPEQRPHPSPDLRPGL
ncbi:acyl carrier protein [Verrucosispora sp. WMMD573]|uniref:acyl carrier protein n=1 Tax=Verrucosispora sp. WMMD573 TaxID=3015149 RepID=UPI00248ACE01|nr:acyl carrier protein [Verrucosispora sp. WMMD573]WBB53792.1 acyl carrier protein [Verrucosispora sp. WMMD573]